MGGSTAALVAEAKDPQRVVPQLYSYGKFRPSRAFDACLQLELGMGNSTRSNCHYCGREAQIMWFVLGILDMSVSHANGLRVTYTAAAGPSAWGRQIQVSAAHEGRPAPS